MVAAALVVAVAVTAPRGGAAASPTLGELVGQRLVVAMAGTQPSASLLGRIRRGEVGGVILFGGNVRSPAQVRLLTASLHRAAQRAGQPRLLVVTDQEGGDVRRLRWAPSTRSAAAMGSRSLSSTLAAGRATGQALRRNGIDVDLAPVADVPRVPGSFLVEQERAFATDAQRVTSQATAFARGLAGAGVLAVAKHFPGLGGARVSTDLAAVSIDGTPAALAADLAPFRAMVGAGVPLVMLSSAAYPAYGREPALWEPAVHRLLRRQLGFTGVTISDALEAVAATRRRPLASVALRAARAGTDLLLLAGDERATAGVFEALVEAGRSRQLPRAELERSHRRIVALKATLGSP